MDYLDLTLPTAAENLALDEALLLKAEDGSQGEILRCWEWPEYAVILGSASRLAVEVNATACQAESVPILRRCSGGGTVLLGPGCLVYALVLSLENPALQDVTPSYRYILDRVSQAVQAVLANRLDQNAHQAGSSDLALGQTKISGNSQRRMRHHLLHHGTLLYDFDIPRIGRYLPMPPRQPAYRQQRNHEQFVTNVPAEAAALRAQLRRSWEAHQPRLQWDQPLVQQLVAEKYANPAWTRRR